MKIVLPVGFDHTAYAMRQAIAHLCVRCGNQASLGSDTCVPCHLHLDFKREFDDALARGQRHFWNWMSS